MKKLLERLFEMLNARDKYAPKVADTDTHSHQPMGVKPLMEVPGGLGGQRNFCTHPDDVRLNGADKILRRMNGGTGGSDDGDPWSSIVNDPGLDWAYGPVERQIPGVDLAFWYNPFHPKHNGYSGR